MIVFLDRATITLNDIDFSQLEKLDSYQAYDYTSEEEIISRAQGAKIIITNKVLIHHKIMEELPELKLIAVIATGYNNVDTKAAKERKIAVCNVPGYASNSVPQHTFALILNLATKVHCYHDEVQAGGWQKANSFTMLKYPTFELAGKTIGIIGFGVIGRAVAKIAESFGMKVLAHDAFGITNSKYSNTDIDKLLRESDIVTLHCPLTDQTRNLINDAAIAKMKKGAMLINTARGGIVDEKALADALNCCHLAGAGIDVLTVEPPKNGNKLINAKNIIVTPHSAWSTVQSRQKLVDQTAANIKAFLRNKPVNIVN